MLEGVEDEVAECCSSKNHSVEWIISKQPSARLKGKTPAEACGIEIESENK
jgi:hypothetical protein